MKEKNIIFIGWIGSSLSLAMYFSYIDQILRNLGGHPGSIILPIITVFNCTSWTCYAWFKPKKEWPIVVCNVPGIFLGITSAVTAFLA
ncbi:MAG: SWEET family sugar transporter [Chthoniobacterales bacterium]|nr:SWEET family sugar transporter [Chthoniobacterales bacterium]